MYPAKMHTQGSNNRKERQMRKKKSPVVLRGSIQMLDNTATVLNQIPSRTRKRIFRENEHPFLVEMVVGEEGETSGTIVKGGVKHRIKKLWNDRVVRSISDKVVGAKLFDRHDSANDPNRPNIGEVVAGNSVRTAGGKMAARAIGWFQDADAIRRTKSGELNTCSIEADCEFSRTGGGVGSWLVDKVDRITGVALGDARVDRPGFPGAGFTSALQMFADDDDLTGASDDEIKAEMKRRGIVAAPTPAAGGSAPVTMENLGSTVKALFADERKANEDEAKAKASDDEKAKLTKENDQLRRDLFIANKEDELRDKIKKGLEGKDLEQEKADSLVSRLVDQLKADEGLTEANIEEKAAGAVKNALEILGFAADKKDDEDAKPPATKPTDAEPKGDGSDIPEALRMD